MVEATEDRQEAISLIRQSASAIIPRTAPLARVRTLRFTQPGFDRGVWKQLADQGWLGLLVAESEGGSGLGMQEFCALCEELGAALVPEPLIPCATAISLLPPVEREKALSGKLIVIPAFREPGSSTINGRTTFSNGVVSGRKHLVPFAGGADMFLVTTADGLSLVEKEAGGLVLDLSDTRDGGHFGHIVFDRAAARALPGSFEVAFEQSALATAAYLLGAARRLFELSLDYVKVRKQFGRQIGAFQVLQHRAVDMRIQLDLARAVLEECCEKFDTREDMSARQSAVSRAKARASTAAMMIAKESTQFHGAMGITDEADVGLYSRKVLTLFNQYGSADWHRSRYLTLNEPACNVARTEQE